MMSKKTKMPSELKYKADVKALDDSMKPKRKYAPNADEGRTQASGKEMDVLEKLVLLDAVLTKGGEVMKPRLANIPNGWRDYRMVSSVLDKLVEKLLETCTVRTLEKLQYMALHCEMYIKPKTICKTDAIVSVHESALKELVNTVCAAECAICFKKGAEVKGCKLRKTLMEIVPLNDIRKLDRCGYADIAMEEWSDEHADE